MCLSALGINILLELQLLRKALRSHFETHLPNAPDLHCENGGVQICTSVSLPDLSIGWVKDKACKNEVENTIESTRVKLARLY